MGEEVLDGDRELYEGEEGAEESNIIVFPDYEKLKVELEKLRTELSMLLLERDELLAVECKNIEMAYMFALGHLEYKAYELHTAVLRLKRKMEYIQAKKNRQEKVLIGEIEGALDSEFAEYKVKLDEMMNKVDKALKRAKGEFLSAEEVKELKKLYRSIVKALHPDLHPDITEAQISLFYSAVTAYESGDLNGLRIIGTMVGEPALLEKKEDGMAFMAREGERLKQLLRILRDEIAKIKSSYPYTMKDLVNSKAKIAEKKAELEETVSQFKEALELYEDRIAELLR